MRQTFVTFETEDTPGQLGRVTQALSDAGVNILAYNSFQGNVAILPDNVDKALTALKQKNVTCAKTECIAIDLPNTKGQLARIATELGKAGVNIENSFGAAGRNPQGTIYLAVDNIQKAEPIVQKVAAPVPGAR